MEKTRDDGLYNPKGKPHLTWIPYDDVELRHSLLIVAHCGTAGHKSIGRAKEHLKDFYWITKNADIQSFCSTCLQCKQVKGGYQIPRPLSWQVHGTVPNEVLCFDFIHMGKVSKNTPHNYEYILVLKDSFSNFVRLVPCEAPTNSTEAVNAILDWFGLFGPVDLFMSDQGSHFKNQVMEDLTRRYDNSHHFTTAYNSQSNGAVENVNKQLLKVFRSLLVCCIICEVCQIREN